MLMRHTLDTAHKDVLNTRELPLLALSPSSMLPRTSLGFKSSVKFAVVGKEPEARASQQKELTLCILFKRKRRKQLRS